MNDLSEQDPDFRRWWSAHHVAARTTGTKTLNHPIAGTLVLEWDTLTAGTDPDQQLIIWTATPDTPTEEGLRFLASWAAGAGRPDGAPWADGAPGAVGPMFPERPGTRVPFRGHALGRAAQTLA